MKGVEPNIHNTGPYRESVKRDPPLPPRTHTQTLVLDSNMNTTGFHARNLHALICRKAHLFFFFPSILQL